MWKARVLSALGRHDEAVALIRQLPFEKTLYAVYAVEVFTRAGLKAEAEQVLARVPEREGKYFALAALGRPGDALAAMDPATISMITSHDVLFNSAYDPIRRDPRFVQLLATLGLTEAHARAQAWRAAHPLPQILTNK